MPIPNQPSAASDSGQACLCCGTPLAGSYCSDCGQDGTIRRLEFRQVVGDALDQVFGLDAALPRTLRELTRDPGGVARRYVAGQRRLYVNPFKYCLAVTALYFLWNQITGLDLIPPESFDGLDPRKAEVASRVLNVVIGNLTNLFFLVLPVYAGVLRLLFRGAGYNFAENYAFVLFVTGHAFLLSMVASLLALVWPEIRFAVRILIHTTFFVYAAVGFYNQRTVGGALRALLGHALYMVVIFITVFVASGVVLAWLVITGKV